MNMIRSCLLQYGYSFKLENSCCSVYMSKTFYGHTPDINGLLNLDRSDTHIHNIDAKRGKSDNDSASYLWHCHLSHVGIKHMKKLHVDGSLDSLVFEKIETCKPCLLVDMHEETPYRWIVWTYLILNHLRHANYTTWAR